MMGAFEIVPEIHLSNRFNFFLIYLFAYIFSLRFTNELLDFDLKYFWAWTDFQSYLDFMLATFFIGAIVTYFMLPYHWFMETIGFLATFIEAMLGKLNSNDYFS